MKEVKGSKDEDKTPPAWFTSYMEKVRTGSRSRQVPFQVCTPKYCSTAVQEHFAHLTKSMKMLLVGLLMIAQTTRIKNATSLCRTCAAAMAVLCFHKD